MILENYIVNIRTCTIKLHVHIKIKICQDFKVGGGEIKISSRNQSIIV